MNDPIVPDGDDESTDHKLNRLRGYSAQLGAMAKREPIRETDLWSSGFGCGLSVGGLLVLIVFAVMQAVLR